MASRTSITVFAACMLLCTGCAVFNRDNTPTLNFVENRMLPEKGAARYAAYPLLLPVALVAVTVDAVVVRPVSVAHDALLDTQDALWEHFNWQHEYVTTCFALVPRTLATPIVLAGSFLGRSTFDIEPRGGRPRLRERRPSRPGEEGPDPQLVAQAKVALKNERYDEAEALIDKACAGVVRPTEEALAVKAAALLGQGDFDSFRRLGRPWLARQEVVDLAIARVLRSGSSVEQMKLLTCWRHWPLTLPAPSETASALEALLGTQDRAIAMRALEILGDSSSDGQIRSILQRVAQGQDAVLAVAAQSYLK